MEENRRPTGTRRPTQQNTRVDRPTGRPTGRTINRSAGRPAARPAGTTERPVNRPCAGQPVRTTRTAPPANKRRRRYRLLPVVIFGLIVALLSALVLSLIYSAYCYLASKNGNVSVIAPTFIYCVVILIASAVMTKKINGRSLAPSFIVALLFFFYSVGYSIAVFGFAELKWSSVLIKLILSAVAAFAGYMVAAVYSLWKQQKIVKARRQTYTGRRGE